MMFVAQQHDFQLLQYESVISCDLTLLSRLTDLNSWNLAPLENKLP